MTDTITERQALLTDEERAAIQARLDAATPGPWRVVPDTDERIVDAGDVYFVAEADKPADAELIAHAPADLAALLVENQRLRDTIQAAKAEAWAEGHTFGIAFPATAESVSNPYHAARGVSGE